jgi:hypothetical protein
MTGARPKGSAEAGNSQVLHDGKAEEKAPSTSKSSLSKLTRGVMESHM